MNNKYGKSEKRLAIVDDDGCAFCRRAVAAIRARDRQRQFQYIPWSTPGLVEQYSGLALENFHTGMRLIEPDGKVHIGADAIYRITLRLPYFRWFSWTYRLPLLKTVIRRGYSWIAANRIKLSRYCSDDCKLDVSGDMVSPADSRYYMSVPQILISILIVLVIGLHGWANVAKALVPSSLMGDRSWPFLAYGMYRKSYAPGTIRTTKRHVFAITGRGKELKVVLETVGLHWTALNRHYVNPMRSGNQSAARLLADRMNVGREDPVIAFRIQSDNYAIFDRGVVLVSSRSRTYQVGN